MIRCTSFQALLFAMQSYRLNTVSIELIELILIRGHKTVDGNILRLVKTACPPLNSTQLRLPISVLKLYVENI
jgi:hypothetical protein